MTALILMGAVSTSCKVAYNFRKAVKEGPHAALDSSLGSVTGSQLDKMERTLVQLAYNVQALAKLAGIEEEKKEVDPPVVAPPAPAVVPAPLAPLAAESVVPAPPAPLAAEPAAMGT